MDQITDHMAVWIYSFHWNDKIELTTDVTKRDRDWFNLFPQKLETFLGNSSTSYGLKLSGKIGTCSASGRDVSIVCGDMW